MSDEKPKIVGRPPRTIPNTYVRYRAVFPLRLPSKHIMLPPPERFTPQRLTALRTGFGLSRYRFANFIGISAITLDAWESGAHRVPPQASLYLQLLELKENQAWLLKHRNPFLPDEKSQKRKNRASLKNSPSPNHSPSEKLEGVSSYTPTDKPEKRASKRKHKLAP